MNLEIVTANLDRLGFEGIIESENNKIEAFMLENDYLRQNVEEGLKKAANSLGFEYSMFILKEQNWNETWESNFDPVTVADKFRIRAPFHEKSDQKLIEILIEPKMSFGTGHHATTYLMLENLLEMEIKD